MQFRDHGSRTGKPVSKECAEERIRNRVHSHEMAYDGVMSSMNTIGSYSANRLTVHGSAPRRPAIQGDAKTNESAGIVIYETLP